MTVKDADGGDVLRSGRRQGGTDRRTPGIRVVPWATNLQTAAVLHLGRITPRLSSRHREGSTRSCPASTIDRERGDRGSTLAEGTEKAAYAEHLPAHRPNGGFGTWGAPTTESGHAM